MKSRAAWLIAGFIMLATVNLYAADYRVEPASSNIIFRVKHMGLALVRGEFREFNGTFTVEDDKLSAFEGKVTMDSLVTGNKKRDSDLKADTFFSVLKFPFMTVKSKNIAQNADTLAIETDLTIRDVTRTIKLQGKINYREGAGPELTLSGDIDRRDFNLRLNKFLEFFVGEKVNISLQLKGIK